MVRSTTYVLDGTLFFNQDLKDGVFHVEGTPFRPAFEKEKPAEAKARPKARRAGVDFVDAEKKLDAALADPARRAPAADAKASLRAEGASSAAVAWAVGGLGVAALLAAGAVALRRR